VEKQTDGSNTLPIIRHLMNLPRGYNSGFNGVSSILGSHDQIGCRKVRGAFPPQPPPPSVSRKLLTLAGLGLQPCQTAALREHTPHTKGPIRFLRRLVSSIDARERRRGSKASMCRTGLPRAALLS
jgi:hypothetical protein